MGNKMGRRRLVVEDKYTRPQGLYHHQDVDHKKLRKLILDAKLAPCFPGDDDGSALDLEECPICFLYYPSLNRSRCCAKGICTECFLQMKPPHSNRPIQCPFCKTSNYAVEYRGARTKEEKSREQIEEQRVIEAQIRLRQKELEDEEDRMQKRHDADSLTRVMESAEDEYRDVPTYEVPILRYPTCGNELVSSQASCSVSASRWPSHSRQNREDNFDMDPEDIMVLEAVWLSAQDYDLWKNPPTTSSHFPEQLFSEDYYNSQVIAPSMEASPSGGLACAVAALAERQHMTENATTNAQTLMLRPSSLPTGEESAVMSCYPLEGWVGVSSSDSRAFLADENGGEVGTSYASSNCAGSAALLLPGGFNMAAGPILPESFEEQMMVAMAVSLAEARARMASSQGLTWL